MIGRDAFSVLAPVLGPYQENLAMSPSSTVHGSQHDAKYVTFELLLHAAFVVDEHWGFLLEPARICCPAFHLGGNTSSDTRPTMDLVPGIDF